MDSKSKQSKVKLSDSASKDAPEDQGISGDIQELLDDYLGVPPDLQSLISDYLHIKDSRKRKKKKKKK